MANACPMHQATSSKRAGGVIRVRRQRSLKREVHTDDGRCRGGPFTCACGRGSRRRICHSQRQHARRAEHAIPCRHRHSGGRIGGDSWLPCGCSMVRCGVLRRSRVGSWSLRAGAVSKPARLCGAGILPSTRNSDRGLQRRKLLGPLLSQSRLLSGPGSLAPEFGL